MGIAKAFVKGVEGIKSTYNAACGDWIVNNIGTPQRNGRWDEIQDSNGTKIYDTEHRGLSKVIGGIVGGLFGGTFALAALGSGLGLAGAFTLAAAGAGLALVVPNIHAAVSATSYGLRKLYNSGIEQIESEQLAQEQARMTAEANDNTLATEEPMNGPISAPSLK